MEDKKLVSIIVPIYNVEEYLSKSIDSMINQKYSNIEIILVDDGSTDKSKYIVDEYASKDNRIKVIHKENGGVSSAKNTGLAIAQGEFITFIDPDDYVENDYIEYLLKLMIENGSDISLSRYHFDNYNMKQVSQDRIITYTSKEALIDILTYNINVAVWNKMYKASFLKENNIKFYEDIFMGEGFNFNICSFKEANKITIGFRKVYFYRRDNNNSATTKFKMDKWNNALFAITRIEDNLKTEDKDINKALIFAKWRTNVDAFTLMCLASKDKDYPDFYKQTKRVGKKYFYIPFKLKTSKADKIRGIAMLISPNILATLLKLRRKLHKVNVKN